MKSDDGPVKDEEQKWTSTDQKISNGVIIKKSSSYFVFVGISDID